jgi:hypothetical protein
MGGIYGNTPMYQVLAFDADAEEIGPAAFEGPRAFSRAGELLDQLRADPAVMEVALMRLDGGAWVYVERHRCNDRGEWVAIPFSQEYPSPVDEDDE